MTKKELLKQLHNLNEQIKPDVDWKSRNRDILMSQIKAQTEGESVGHKIPWHGLLSKNFMAMAYKPLGATILIIGIVFGGYTMTVGAAKNSLPGDFLYSFKLTGERVQVNLAGDNDEKKANLEIEFAQRRLNEIQKVVAKSDEGSKKENLQVPLQKYQESLNNIKSSLSKLEKTDTETALKVAKLVDEKTKDYVDVLNDQKEKTPELDTAVATKDAITASKSTTEKALDMIINQYKAGSKEVTLDMVIQALEKKFTGLNASLAKDTSDLDKIIVNMAKAKELAAKQPVISAQETPVSDESCAENCEQAETEGSNTNENTNINVDLTPAPIEAPVEVLPTPEAVKARFKEVQNLLAQARAYLSTKEVMWSYAKMKEAQDILTLVDKVIEANKQYLEEPKVEPAVEEPAPADEVISGNVNATSVEVPK